MRIHTIKAGILFSFILFFAGESAAGWLFWKNKPKSRTECLEHNMTSGRSTSAKYYLRNACRHKFNPSIIWPEEVCDCVLDNMNRSRSNIASHYISKACRDRYGTYQKKGWPDAMCECIIENMKEAATDGEAAAILQHCRKKALR